MSPNNVVKQRRSRVAKWFRYRGLLVVALWQVPMGPVVRPDGSIAFLFGAGADELANISCEGDLLEARRVRYRVVGIEADHNLSQRFRIAGTAGFISADVESYGGPFAAGQLRLDFKYVGLGAGLYTTPHLDYFDDVDGEQHLFPSLLVRIGSAEKVHLRADMFPPSTLGMQQVIRLGVGVNATQRDRPSGFLSLAGVGNSTDGLGASLDLDLPVSSRAVFTLRSHYGDGYEYDVVGAMIGGRILFD
jgi:hypothetical protein